MYGGPPPSAPTPWLQPADRYSVRCEQSNSANVLMATPIGSSRKLNPSPTPDWGLHLADANLPLGDLVDLVGTEAGAYLRSTRVRLSVRRQCTRRGLRISVTGPDRRLVRRIDVLVGGRRVARDRRTPFSVIVRRAGPGREVALLRDGRTVPMSFRARSCG